MIFKFKNLPVLVRSCKYNDNRATNQLELQPISIPEKIELFQELYKSYLCNPVE